MTHTITKKKKICEKHDWIYSKNGDRRDCKNCPIYQMKSGYELIPNK